MLRQTIALLFLAACGPESDRKPSGTTADPVEVCEDFGQVCRIDSSRLGVCVKSSAGTGFACQSQH